MSANKIVSAQQWSPLLGGSLRDQVLDAVQAIACDLLHPESRTAAGMEAAWPHSLAYGDAGLALFFHYWHLVNGDNSAGNARDGLLHAATQALSGRRMVPDLFRGYSGVAWLWNHINSDSDPVRRSQAWIDIDQALMIWVQQERTPTELLEGIGGLCLYVAESFPSATAHELFRAILERIGREACRQGIGRALPMSYRFRQYWFSIYGTQPTNLWKLSVAHGNAGSLAAVAAALLDNSFLEVAAPILEESCEWVWSHQRSGTPAFPEIVGAELSSLTSGWCNGDLGIALALFQVARRLARTDWQQRSLSIARSEAVIRVDSIESNNRRNYCLCHGFAGRAQIFNRLYHATGEAIFADASIYWIEQCMASRNEGTGVGGFLLHEGFDEVPKLVRGFLMGASGLGLALMAAATSVEPEWDRLLVASIR